MAAANQAFINHIPPALALYFASNRIRQRFTFP